MEKQNLYKKIDTILRHFYVIMNCVFPRKLYSIAQSALWNFLFGDTID